MFYILLNIFFQFQFFHSIKSGIKQVIGNQIYAWGCNSKFQLGRNFPDQSSTCVPSTYYVQTAEKFQNHHPLKGKSFIDFCTAPYGYDYIVVLTHDQIVYSWGNGNIGILGSSVSGKQAIPLVSYNGSANTDETFIKLTCNYGEVLLLNDYGELYGYGQNSYGKFGFLGQVYVPDLLLQNISSSKLFTIASMFSFTNDTENIFVAGRNDYLLFGIPTFPSAGSSNGKILQMNTTVFQGQKIKQMIMALRAYFIILENGDVYSLGDRRLAVLSDFTGYENLPTLANSNFYCGGGNCLPKPNPSLNITVEIKMITCVPTCTMVASVNGRGEAYTWGVVSTGQLGRSTTGSYQVRMINRAWIPSDESIIVCASQHYGGLALTDKGKVFVWGNSGNLYYIWSGRSPSTVPAQIEPNIKNISYISTHQYSHFIISTSFTCYGNFPYQACNGKGICTMQDVCVCDKPMNYTGKECEIFYTCSKIFADDNRVCSKRGDCVSPNKCECFDHAKGYDCEIPECFGFFADNESTCSQKGFCVEIDECICFPQNNSFGLYCNEYIGESEFRLSNEISIEYHLLISLIMEFNPITVEAFNCKEIISNYEILGSQSSCYFEFNPDDTETSFLIINVKNIDIETIEYLIINPITKPSENITVYVEPYEAGSIFQRYWYFFAIGGSALLVVFAILFVCCIGCIMCKQKRVLKKFEKLEDVDLLLMEQSSLRDSSVAHLKIEKKLFEIKYSGSYTASITQIQFRY